MDIVSFSWAVIVMFVIKICSVVSVQYNIGKREREREREKEGEWVSEWVSEFENICVCWESPLLM